MFFWNFGKICIFVTYSHVERSLNLEIIWRENCIWREQNNQLKNIHKTKNVRIFFTEAIINIHKNLEKSRFGNFSPPL